MASLKSGKAVRLRLSTHCASPVSRYLQTINAQPNRTILTRPKETANEAAVVDEHARLDRLRANPLARGFFTEPAGRDALRADWLLMNAGHQRLNRHWCAADQI